MLSLLTYLIIFLYEKIIQIFFLEITSFRFSFFTDLTLLIFMSRMIIIDTYNGQHFNTAMLYMTTTINM